MNIDEKVALISSNTEEVITPDALFELVKKKKRPVVYVGYEPSGPVHLGHFVTFAKLMDFEKAGFKVLVLLADVHTMLNRKGDMSVISKEVARWEKTIKAFGLKCEVVLGSSFQFKKEYQFEVMSLAQSTSINRGLRSMQEIARDVKNATISQLWYPLMQAVDIKFLNVDVAVGGMEQRKVHMIAKDLSRVLKYSFVAVHTPLITSLKGPGEKMSKSIPGSGISFLDDKATIEKSIRSAYCSEKDISDNPVLQIARLIVFPRIKSFKVSRPEKFGGNVSFESYDKLAGSFASGDLHPADLKVSVAGYIEDIVAPIRKSLK